MRHSVITRTVMAVEVWPGTVLADGSVVAEVKYDGRTGRVHVTYANGYRQVYRDSHELEIRRNR